MPISKPWARALRQGVICGGSGIRSCGRRICTAKHPKPLEILGEKFTIYRGEDGIAHITNARCPHRGALMSLGWVEGDGIRCRFHGWRFDGTGQCDEQPNEDRPFCARVKLKNLSDARICRPHLRLSRRGRAAAVPQLSGFRSARRDRRRSAGGHSLHILESARHRQQPCAVGASRDGVAHRPDAKPHPAQGKRQRDAPMAM